VRARGAERGGTSGQRLEESWLPKAAVVAARRCLGIIVHRLIAELPSSGIPGAVDSEIWHGCSYGAEKVEFSLLTVAEPPPECPLGLKIAVEVACEIAHCLCPLFAQQLS
jgi:hypothetical protein